MSVLVLVEGVSDAGFVKGIAERVGAAIKVCTLHGNKPDKAKRVIKAETRTKRIERVVVLKDEHQYPELVERVERELRESAIVVRVKSSLESWILIGLCVKSSEVCDNPVERLREILAWKVHLKNEERYRKLAKEVDIEKLKECSTSFREFLKALSGR